MAENQRLRCQILGGKNQIGGNCIYLHYGKTNLLLDIGKPLNDNLSHGEKRSPVISAPDFDIPDVDYCIISHPHMDHWGFLPFLPEKAIIFSGVECQTIIKISLYVSRGPIVKNEWKTFRPGVAFGLGDFLIQPFLIDHSAYDAYAFLITAGDEHLLYTGDIRFHGRKAWLSERLPDLIKVPIDLLICEGTNLGGQAEGNNTVEANTAATVHESDLEESFADAFKQNRLPAIVQVSGQNIDRLVTIYRASKKANRKLVLDPYTAFLINRLKNRHLPHLGSFDDVRVLLPEEDEQWRHVGLNRKKLGWMKPYAITAGELIQDPMYVLIFRYWIGQYVSERAILPDGSRFIYSMSSYYLASMSAQWGELSERIADGRVVFQKIHASGHASPSDLSQFIQRINPKQILPIHTQNPSWFDRFDSEKVAEECDCR